MNANEAVVARFAAGEISPEIALAQLLLLGEVPDAAGLPAPVAALARAHAGRLEALAGLARSGFDPQGEDQVAATAALFDRLATTAPEAAVAFYTLGDPALLAAATAELVAVIRRWAPLEGAAVLDFGCGIGRVARALAPIAREVTGIDLSANMIAEARRRATQPNLSFEGSDGGALRFAAAHFDCVLAIDCFPFLVRADLLDRQLAEFARVLRPGGTLIVFNWSYRGDPAQDDAEARQLGSRHGLEPERVGERPFAIWDGMGYQFRRTA